MSGLAGVLQRDGGPSNAIRLDKAAKALAHRGPDGEFTWIEGPAALAYLAFDTAARQDPALGLFDDGRVVVAADARLDDRESLRASLGIENPDASDMALIAGSYRRWGRDCPDKLQGDFAFAIWDREERVFFCARDHFGVKPFYYSMEGGRFTFASEVKGILRSFDKAFEIREEAIGEYLAGAPVDPCLTFYQGIFNLPPAHSLRVGEHADLETTRYWTLKPGSAPPSTNPVEDFRRLFQQAVARRTPTRRRIGALLSGGLDSSSIVAVASPVVVTEKSERLPTISVVFDKTPQWSERPFIESVLSRTQCRPTFISMDEYAPFADLEQALNEQDRPFFAPGQALSYQTYAAAAAQSLGVILDGHGGDETVSHGYGRLDDLAASGRWWKLWKELDGSSGLYGASKIRMFRVHLLNHGLLGRLARRAVRIKRAFRRGPQPPPAFLKFVNKTFADRIGLAERRALLTPPMPRGEQARHLANLVSTNGADAFEIASHRAAAGGIEVRYPFWDKDLVEFCLNLPSEEKCDGGWTRLILRKAMNGWLPADVQWRRSKLDFAPHIILGMLKWHSDLLDRVILKDSGNVAKYVDLEELTRAYDRLKAQRENTSSSDIIALFRAVILSEWNRLRLASPRS